MKERKGQGGKRCTVSDWVAFSFGLASDSEMKVRSDVCKLLNEYVKMRRGK